MCIASVIFNPLKQSDIQLMYDANPHGGGMGWLDKSTMKLKYKKGLNAKQLFELQESGEVSYPYMLHLRWATHGPKVPELCHPFPIGVAALFDSPEGEADQLLQHNGTWSDYSRWVPTWLPQKVQDNLSDTAVCAYVVDFFPDILDEVHWATCLASIDPANGEITFKYQGTWSEHGGNKFSNLHWLPNYGYAYKASPYSSDTDYDNGKWWETWKGRDWRHWSRTRDEDTRREAVASRARIAAAKARIHAKKAKEAGLMTAEEASKAEITIRRKGESIRGEGFVILPTSSPYDSGASELQDLGPDWESEADFSDLFDSGTRDPWDNDTSDYLERQDFQSWEQYVEAKYGPRVARMAVIIDPDGTELSNSELESLALSNCSADDDEIENFGSYGEPASGYRGDGETEDVTDVVSEDYTVVNDYLRHMRKVG